MTGPSSDGLDDGRDAANEDALRPTMLAAMNNRDGSMANVLHAGSTLPGPSPLPPIAVRLPLGLAAAGSGPKMPRNDAYEVYKKGLGKELAAALSENKAVLTEKRGRLAELGQQSNSLRTQIDTLKSQISSERDRVLQSDPVHDPALVTVPLSDDTRAKIERVRTLKDQARATFDAATACRSELEYAGRLVDVCRQKLVLGFEHWYEDVYGSSDGPTKIGSAVGTGMPHASSMVAAAVSGPNGTGGGAKASSGGAYAAFMSNFAGVDLAVSDMADNLDAGGTSAGQDAGSGAYYAALAKRRGRKFRTAAM
ncbi:hypothetical protein BC828DRAFT_376757 [Blastocladiella britannica]|nr:hypothetical protein BC828DRAFT_376757 [Blastocladiella britannica]